jgi:hypothetical protein
VRRSDLPAKNDNAVFLMDRGGWFAGKPGSYRSGLARQTKTPDLRRPGVIVPMLRVGMQPVTLCVTAAMDAERPVRHSHAERGNDHQD